MQKVQENDDQLKASVTSVTDMIGKEIATMKQEGQATASDLSSRAVRIDAKLVEMHAAMKDLCKQCLPPALVPCLARQGPRAFSSATSCRN